MLAMIRPAAVAGQFYPANPHQLAQDVRQFLNEAQSRERLGAELRPKALVVPHAGYVYSGSVAASAYATLESMASQVRRVVLLGPAHRVAVQGLALPGVEQFETPLGRIPLDLELERRLIHLPQVVISPEAHAQEHSLEVQLPFLQTVLPNFRLLPLVVGLASEEEVADVLERVWGGEETLIVVSSDLSHYLPYAMAQRVDRSTVQAIVELQHPIAQEQACGGTPINGLILAAKGHQLQAHLLDLRNSGDTAGPRDHVVGYAAIAFTGGQGDER